MANNDHFPLLPSTTILVTIESVNFESLPPSWSKDCFNSSRGCDDGGNDSKFTLSIEQFKKNGVLLLFVHLSVDDVKPLYDAGFKGNVLGNIVGVKYAIDQLKTTFKDGGNCNDNRIVQLLSNYCILGDAQTLSLVVCWSSQGTTM